MNEILLALSALKGGANFFKSIWQFFDITPGQKKQYDYLDDIADENARVAYERQRQMQEDYFSPEAQMRSAAAGYDAIGLNRMGMAGFQAGASASNVGQAPAPSGAGDAAAGMESFSHLLGTLLEKKRISYESKIADADVEHKQSLTNHQNIVNNYTEKLLQLEVEERSANRDLVIANTRKISADAQYSEILATYAPNMLEASIGKDAAAAALSRAEVELSKKRQREIISILENHKYLRSQIDAEILKIQQECLNLAKQRDVSDQDILESKQRIEKMQEEINVLGSQAGLNNLEIKYYQFNHAKEISTVLGRNFYLTPSGDKGIGILDFLKTDGYNSNGND